MCSALFAPLGCLRYFKVLPFFGRLEIYQSWEEQDHVPSLVHDWCTTVRATDFAGQLMDAGFLRAFVPAEIMVAMGEVYVLLVKDGCPLERCT